MRGYRGKIGLRFWKKTVLGILGCCGILTVQAQIDSVAMHLQKIKACPEDSLKIKYADRIVDFLAQTAFGTYPVSAPVKYLGYKQCSNAEVELFSWSIPLEQGLAYYNWFRFKGNGKTYYLRTLPGGEKESVPAYLFYDLLAFESNQREYFVLLGWAQTRKSNRKAIWIARFDRNGTVNFKSRLMRKGKSRSASLAFEYSREGGMMLKHDSKGKRIIFDHLAPIDPKYEGYFMFYGPDGSYDALELKKGEWWWEENIKKIKDRK